MDAVFVRVRFVGMDASLCSCVSFVCLWPRDSWVRSGSSGPSWCAMGVAGFFGFVWFVQERPGCRLVHSGSSASFRNAIVVACFVRVRLVCSRVCPGCC